MLHQVGAGVLGPVFRALDPDQERMVGIKLFRLDMPPEQSARLAEQLGAVVDRLPAHEGLVRPLAAGLDGATAYLVTDYVAADSIDQRLRRRIPTPLDQILPLLEQMAAALDAAAAAGFLHGALHPRDVLVSTKGAVSLTGVGVTQALEAVAWRPPFRRPYAAPERVAGRRWDASADVFSLAVLAVELASGRRPLMPESSPALPSLGVEDEVRGQAVRRVLANALDEDATLRDRSATRWVFRLSEAVRGVSEALELSAPPAEGGEAGVGGPLHLAPAGQPALAMLEPPPDDDLPLHPVVPEVEQTESEASEVTATAAATHDRGDRPPVRSSRVETESLDRLKEAAARMPEARSIEDSWSRLVAAGKRVSLTESVLVAQVPPLPRADTGAPPLRPMRADLSGVPDTVSPVVPRRGRPLGPVIAAIALACLALGFGAGYWMARRPASPATAATGVSPPAAGAAVAPPIPVVNEPKAPAPQPTRATPEPARSSGRPPTGAAARPAPPATASRPPSLTATPPAAPQGRMLVRSTPAAASVRVNGVLRGKTPLALRELAYGTYKVLVEAPGYAPAERDIILSGGSPSGTLTFELVRAGDPSAGQPRAEITTAPASGRAINPAEASVDVVSAPSGARVYVDGRLVGTTPLRVSGLNPGSHSLRLEQSGYGPWNGSVTAAAGRVTRVSVTLEPSR